MNNKQKIQHYALELRGLMTAEYYNKRQLALITKDKKEIVNSIEELENGKQ